MDKGLGQQWRVDWFDSLIRRFGGGGFVSRQVETALDRRLFYRSKRLLDLACLEGLFAIEFARKVLGLSNCRLIKGDVRSISAELGSFDVILCAGILYHLDFPDCVRF